MFIFSPYFRNLNNIGKCISLFLISGFFVLVGFSSDSYASDIRANDGDLQVNASICYDAVNSGHNYYACVGEREIVLPRSGFIDDKDISYYFRHSDNQGISSLQMLIDDFDNYDCDVSRTCYLKITKVIYSPKLYDFDQQTRTSLYVTQDEYFDFKFSTNFLNFYFGDGDKFYSWANDFYFVYGGLDTYLNYNLSTQYSCLDVSDGSCEMRYYFYHNADHLDQDGTHNSLITRGQAVDSDIFSFMPVDNPYDTYEQTYSRSAYNSLLFFNPIHLNDTYWFYATVDFTYGDTFHDWEGGNSFNPDDISIDWDFQEDKVSDAPQLGDISIPIFNPISSWLVLFTDNQCIDISVVPSWFGLSQQHICSPWNSTIKGFITPVISVASIMLIFGFAMRWLKGKEDYNG